jgi:GT2 family glycosyltransferase
MISFVLLNWNSGDFLRRALDALRGQTSPDWELIIVDNGSTNSSVQVLEEFCSRYPVKKLVLLERNVGFATGMNIGLAYADGNLIVPLNTDVYLSETFVERVQAFAECETRAPSATQLGMIAVPVYQWRYDSSEDILTGNLQTVGVSLTKRFALSYWHPHFESTDSLLGPSGCAPIFTRSALEAAKEFAGHTYDPTYISFGEDTDLYIRLRALGYRAAYCAATAIWHIGSASTSGELDFHSKPVELQRLSHINDWRTFKKLRNDRQKCAIFPWMVLNDAHTVVTSPMRLRILRGLLSNYRTLLTTRPSVRYPRVAFSYAGSVFSRSATFLKAEGRLPPVSDTSEDGTLRHEPHRHLSDMPGCASRTQ